jgi:hypothetical protein
MKKIVILFISAINIMLNAQENGQILSSAEKFSKCPAKIIKSLIIYDERFSSILEDQANLSLIQFSEYSGKDTIYGLKFHGDVIIASGQDITIRKKYCVILDYDELEKIIIWIDLVKSNLFDKASSDKRQVSYISKKSNLLLRYYNNRFEVQYDKFDENSISSLGRNQLDNLYDKLNDIKKLWPKAYQQNN